MSKKKLISIVLSALLTVLAAVLGCTLGIKVDFSDIDVDCAYVTVADFGRPCCAYGQP